MGSVGVYHQISNLDGFTHVPFVERGVELNITSGANLFTQEADNLIILRLHFLLNSAHLLKCYPVEDVYRTPLIHQHFHDGEVVNVDYYNHRVILKGVDAFKVLISESDGRHARLERDDVLLLYRP